MSRSILRLAITSQQPKPVPVAAYADQQIDVATFVTFVAQNVILTGFTSYLVLNARRTEPALPPVAVQEDQA